MTATQAAPITAMPAIELPGRPKTPRLASLDIFRGITIAAMLLVNHPGKGEAYSALIHAGEQGAGWNGWTPTDLIFPFFLFIVGVATPFSLGSRGATVERSTLLAKIWGRAFALFMLGELLTGMTYSNMTPPPPGFESIGMLRIGIWVFSLSSIVLLLSPWKSAKLSLLLPLVIGVLFYAGAFAINWANHHWLANGLPADFKFGNGLMSPHRLRIPGVLQRIGICYGVAATVALYAGWRTALAGAVILCAGYSVLMLKAPYHDHVTGSISKEDNLARRIDEDLLIKQGRWNHAYGEYPDNEGFLSTLPAIATVLIGIVVGIWLRTFRSASERCAGMLVFGLFTLLLGMALDKWLMPINKEIWTPAFTVFTAGMGMLCLGTIFYFVDVLDYRRWALPFQIYGMNAIAAFVAAGIAVRVLALWKITPPKYEAPVSVWSFCKDWAASGVATINTSLQHVLPAININTPQNTSLVFSLLFVLAILVLMSVLYICKIFIKV